MENQNPPSDEAKAVNLIAFKACQRIISENTKAYIILSIDKEGKAEAVMDGDALSQCFLLKLADAIIAQKMNPNAVQG